MNKLIRSFWQFYLSVMKVISLFMDNKYTLCKNRSFANYYTYKSNLIKMNADGI